MTLRTPLYRLRAVTHGNEYWTCPYCANKNTSRLSPDHCVVACTGTSCGGRFYPGRLFIPVPAGRQRPPADWVVPDGNALRESFPRGELWTDPYRAGDRVHHLYAAEMEAEYGAAQRFVERVEASGARMDKGSARAVRGELERMEGEVAAARAERIRRFGRS